MRLCIIPARGGSKRIPRKNIREFAGKPMIAWSIEAAQKSDCFDSIIVSTDDEEIREVAKCYGAEVPFKRPEVLSDDFTPTTKVVSHAVEWYLNNGYALSQVCCLYATAPLVVPEDIKKAQVLLRSTAQNWFIFSACAYSSPTQRAMRLDPASGQIRMCHPDFFTSRTQDLEPTFHDAAQFYWGRAGAWLGVDNIFDYSTPLFVPRWRAQDIDTEEDWHQVELLYRMIVQNNPKHG